MEAAAELQDYRLDWSQLILGCRLQEWRSALELVLPPPASPLAKCMPLATSATAKKAVGKWGVSQMVEYAKSLDLPGLDETIIRNGVDGKWFLAYTEAELVKVGFPLSSSSEINTSMKRRLLLLDHVRAKTPLPSDRSKTKLSIRQRKKFMRYELSNLGLYV